MFRLGIPAIIQFASREEDKVLPVPGNFQDFIYNPLRYETPAHVPTVR
jgi:hypothetical protein